MEGERRLKKRSVSAKALVEDIGNGLSDAELMSRHEIGYAQLQKFFAQLIQAGYIAPEVLVGRSHDETGAASAELSGNDEQATRPEWRSSKPPHSVPPEPHPVTLSPDRGPQLQKHHDDALSLPMSREQASRFRRNGLILILASFGFMTMGIILAKLRESAEVGGFAIADVGAVLAVIAPVGWMVSAVLGFLWRVRGLGQHAVWAIVAPFFWINVLVMEALPNRYEPNADRRGLRLAVAASGLAVWTIALSQIVKLL